MSQLISINGLEYLLQSYKEYNKYSIVPVSDYSDIDLVVCHKLGRLNTKTTPAGAVEIPNYLKLGSLLRSIYPNSRSNYYHSESDSGALLVATEVANDTGDGIARMLKYSVNGRSYIISNSFDHLNMIVELLNNQD